jgi:hypothetical protein
LSHKHTTLCLVAPYIYALAHTQPLPEQYTFEQDQAEYPTIPEAEEPKAPSSTRTSHRQDRVSITYHHDTTTLEFTSSHNPTTKAHRPHRTTLIDYVGDRWRTACTYRF